MFGPPQPPVPPASAPTLGGGRYRLASKIGEGGMAVVYRGWDTREQAWRAIKVLTPECARKRQTRARFEAEARVMTRISHRHVCKIFEVGVERDLPFLVMELCEGGSLHDWVQTHGPMPARTAVDVIIQMCKAVRAVHEQGVVHRDIKPQNMLMTSRDVCKLIDFGVAQVDDAGGVTQTGSVLGTMGYMAPEQRIDSSAVDARADVYGLGATLYRLITAGTVADLFLAEHDRSLLARVPEPLWEIILRSTAYNAEDRYAGAQELARALHVVRKDLPDPEREPPPLALPDAMTETDLRDDDDPVLETMFSQTTQLGATTEARRTPDLAPSPVLLPYTMPVQAPHRRGEPSDDDVIPDYVDLASLTNDRRGFEVKVDDDTRRQAEEARQKAMADGLLDPEGRPVQPDPIVVAPPADAAVAEDAADAATFLFRAVGAALLNPLGLLVIASLVIAAATGILATAGASQVNGARSEAYAARTEFYEALQREERIIQDLVVLGANRAPLEASYLTFLDSGEEPDKGDAAIRYFVMLDEAVRKYGSRGRAGALGGQHGQAAEGGMERIRSELDALDGATTRWQVEAGSPTGVIAVKLGLASAPSTLLPPRPEP